MQKYLHIILFFFVSVLFSVVVIAVPKNSFAEEQSLIGWPVQSEAPWEHIRSPFGPRLLASEGYRYDFHRGIDIPGTTTDAVVSIADGEVFRVYADGDPVSPYPDSGNVVIVKHTFTTPYTFHEKNFSTYYSLYAHLSSIEPLVQGDGVTKGQRIGFVGDTGSADYSHLHFEIRIGTTCSLESSCNKGYDPHVNPLLFLPYPESNTLQHSLTQNGSTVVLSLAIPKKELDMNRIEILSPKRKILKVLDWNTREGVDASTTESLDQQEYNGIRIEPEVFNSESTHERLAVEFADMCTQNRQQRIVQIYDAHGNVLQSSRLVCRVQ